MWAAEAGWYRGRGIVDAVGDARTVLWVGEDGQAGWSCCEGRLGLVEGIHCGRASAVQALAWDPVPLCYRSQKKRESNNVRMV